MVLKKALLDYTEQKENSLSMAWGPWSCSLLSTAVPSPFKCLALVPYRMPLLCALVFPFG